MVEYIIYFREKIIFIGVKNSDYLNKLFSNIFFEGWYVRDMNIFRKKEF